MLQPLLNTQTQLIMHKGFDVYQRTFSPSWYTPADQGTHQPWTSSPEDQTLPLHKLIVLILMRRLQSTLRVKDAQPPSCIHRDAPIDSSKITSHLRNKRPLHTL
jgi:hypothetical protein